MRKIVLSLVALGALTAGCTAASTSTIPQSGKVDQTQTQTTAPATAPANAEDTTVTAPAKVTSCDVFRKALPTGNQADINRAIAGLKADKSADPTARENADYYLHRDATNKQMQGIDIGNIRVACAS
jgi:uncharacterized protein YceK